MTNLTGATFQRAHLALKAREREQTTGTPRIPPCAVTRKLEVVAAILGILLAIAALVLAGQRGLERGSGWQTGRYATAASWND